jgi:hypothetical protein
VYLCSICAIPFPLALLICLGFLRTVLLVIALGAFYHYIQGHPSSSVLVCSGALSLSLDHSSSCMFLFILYQISLILIVFHLCQVNMLPKYLVYCWLINIVSVSYMSRRKPRGPHKASTPPPRPPSPYHAFEVHWVYSGGRVTRHQETPDPEVEHANRWAWSILRQDMTGFVRNFSDKLQFSVASPTDPHATWAMATSPIFGLQLNVVPGGVDLSTSRIGRAFQWQCDTNQSSTIPLVIFPADPLNPLCPPYPRPPPIDLDDPRDPSTCFSDGGLGKWDPCYYPQLYDSARPWIPYHQAPQPVWWWYDGYTSETMKSGVYPLNLGKDVFPPTPYYLPVTEFFVWKQPGHPNYGGSWKQDLLATVFVARTSVEKALLAMVVALHGPLPGYSFESYKLPWYDELKYEEAQKWMTWQEGRDALRRTCHYIAELKAFTSWLWATRSMSRNPPWRQFPCKSEYSTFMGTWAVMISTKNEWTDLNHGYVPIYVIS